MEDAKAPLSVSMTTSERVFRRRSAPGGGGRKLVTRTDQLIKKTHRFALQDLLLHRLQTDLLSDESQRQKYGQQSTAAAQVC